jgi:hypothetical protein
MNKIYVKKINRKKRRRKKERRLFNMNSSIGQLRLADSDAEVALRPL